MKQFNYNEAEALNWAYAFSVSATFNGNTENLPSVEPMIDADIYYNYEIDSVDLMDQLEAVLLEKYGFYTADWAKENEGFVAYLYDDEAEYVASVEVDMIYSDVISITIEKE